MLFTAGICNLEAERMGLPQEPKEFEIKVDQLK